MRWFSASIALCLIALLGPAELKGRSAGSADAVVRIGTLSGEAYSKRIL